MGETLDALLGGEPSLGLVDNIDDDVRSTLSVIVYTNAWGYAFVRCRQRQPKQKYDQRIEQNLLFQSALEIKPLQPVKDAYYLFINLEIPTCWAKNKVRIQRECHELLQSLYYPSCESLDAQEAKEDIT